MISCHLQKFFHIGMNMIRNDIAIRACSEIQNNNCGPPRTMLLVGKTDQILTRNLYGLRRWC